jgi:hypothetical protein
MFKVIGKIIGFDGMQIPGNVTFRGKGKKGSAEISGSDWKNDFTIEACLSAYDHMLPDFSIGDEFELTITRIERDKK